MENPEAPHAGMDLGVGRSLNKLCGSVVLLLPDSTSGRWMCGAMREVIGSIANACLIGRSILADMQGRIEAQHQTIWLPH